MSVLKPLRSVLYLPASNARAVEKARTLPCDGVILDLEDAVAPTAKDDARAAACAAVAAGGYGRRTLAIRINGAGTPWHDADLAAVAQAAPDAIVVPKVGSADEVRTLIATLDAAGAPASLELWAMIETPRAIWDVRQIATASPRLTTLIVGTNDLAKELRAAAVPGRGPLLTVLSLAVLGARAAGVTILDGVFNDTRDTDALAAECRQGRDLGFDGKTLIHPGQIGTANTVFAPGEDAVHEARVIVQAFAEAGGQGVITYRGRMVEALHVEQAEHTLALHEAVLALESGR